MHCISIISSQPDVVAALIARDMSSNVATPVENMIGRLELATNLINGMCVKVPDEILYPDGRNFSIHSKVFMPDVVKNSNPSCFAYAKTDAVASGPRKERE